MTNYVCAHVQDQTARAKRAAKGLLDAVVPSNTENGELS